MLSQAVILAACSPVAMPGKVLTIRVVNAVAVQSDTRGEDE